MRSWDWERCCQLRNDAEVKTAAERPVDPVEVSTDTARPPVRIVGATKRFGSIVALREAQLEVSHGEFMTLLGPSGCGKTTLLNLVAGYLEPDEGEIYVGGARVTDTPPYRRNIGMVFQNYALFPHMDVATNIAYGLRMRRVPRREIDQRVAEALDIVKLGGYESRRPKELSGGQQQRVALARAIVINPSVLLLDEPLSALDKNLRAEMQIELKEIQRRLGITTIFVTHDQSEALSLSDRVVVMSNGEIQQIGSPEEIYRRPATRFVASFVGDINRIEGQVERVEKEIAFIALPASRLAVPVSALPEAGSGSKLVDVFVRAEHLSVIAAPDGAALIGTVEHHVYQGSHVDMYIAMAGANPGRIHVRVPDYDAPHRWPIGSTIGLSIKEGEALIFPRTLDPDVVSEAERAPKNVN
jgi:spermidine/putrescine ABC transporter ATP-binding subunit